MGSDVWSTGAYLGFDLETTGTDPLEALPVSYSLVWTLAGRPWLSAEALVDPGVEIPEAASAVHGITAAAIAADPEAAELPEALETIAGALTSSSLSGVPVLGMNVKYDLTLIDALSRRISGYGLSERGWSGPVIDILVIDRALDKYRKGKRTLSALAEVYGVALSQAHTAAADVEASIEIFEAIRKRYPRSFEGVDPMRLHEMQAGWHRDWAESYNRWRVDRGQDPLAPGEYSWPLQTGGAG